MFLIVRVIAADDPMLGIWMDLASTDRMRALPSHMTGIRRSEICFWTFSPFCFPLSSHLLQKCESARQIKAFAAQIPRYGLSDQILWQHRALQLIGHWFIYPWQNHWMPLDAICRFHHGHGPLPFQFVSLRPSGATFATEIWSNTHARKTSQRHTAHSDNMWEKSNDLKRHVGCPCEHLEHVGKSKCARKDTRTQMQYDHDIIIYNILPYTSKIFQSFAGWMRVRFWPACRKPCTSRLYSWPRSRRVWKMECWCCWCGNVKSFAESLPSTSRVSTVRGTIVRARCAQVQLLGTSSMNLSLAHADWI